MIWEIEKAQQRFSLAHALLGTAQTKLQGFLEEQLEEKGRIKSYGTSSPPSQQLKNKLSQATTIPGGMLTLSLETRSVHDRAVSSLVDDWAANTGWAKAVACVAIIHPADTGWKLATIVEWSTSSFPAKVRRHLFPDVVVRQAKGSPAEGKPVKGDSNRGAASEGIPRALLDGVMSLPAKERARLGGLILESLAATTDETSK
ncbi:MAG TPA: hypothetical protein VGM88_25455 [Kofleriaceae bacterium]|jgi:hypothetical protein